MDLKGKTIILTGAARIGQEVAKSLQAKGATLVLTYRQSREKVAPFGFALKADLSTQEGIFKVVETTVKEFGNVYGLVHMASVYEKLSWEELDAGAWDRGMNVDAKSSFLLGKAVADQMLRYNEGLIKGKIIFFADWSALVRPYPGYLVYNAAKAAVVGLTKSFAKALAPHILVNAVAPGPILQPADLNEEENQEVLAGTLLKRWGTPEDIAKGVCYLLDADFVTGQILTIDGGRTIA